MDTYLFKVVCAVYLLLFNAKDTLSQVNVCGQASLNTRIVGGANAVTGFWPWQVSFQASGNHFCGGSLINQNWVLSAAHCFQSISPSRITVYLGMTSLQGTNINMQATNATSIIIHPQYNQTSNNNDIALVQLSSSVTFNSYVRPVCLAATNSTLPGGTKVWVTGWGKIAYNMSLPSPQTLQEMQLPIVSNSDCANVFGSFITNNMICAGLSSGGKDACQGDDGGPLVVKSNTTWIQAGIVSFGYGCALPNIPGVYTRVSQYQNWINSMINNSQPGFITFSNSNCGSPSLLCLILSLAFIPFLLSFFNL